MKPPYYLVSYAVDRDSGLHIKDTVVPLVLPLNEATVSDIRAHLEHKEGTPVAIIAITKLES